MGATPGMGSVFFPSQGRGGLLLEQPVVARVRRDGIPDEDRVQRASQILNEYADFIRAIIRLQARDKSEEDLFQEFFLVLIRKPVPVGVRYLKSYLYRAVVNHIVDSMRARETYYRALKKYAGETGISVNNRHPGNASIDDTEERNARIAYFARHLQEREAQAFVLRYRDNYSVREIATSMGVNVRTVSRYLAASVRRLRDTLAAD